MEVFIFIAFQLLMEVQSYKAPAVKVSPDVLSESSSVKMICETPADVTVKQCYFYRNSEQKNIKVSPSCELDLTGAEVLRWADVKSPASVDIYCFYTITEHRINKPSSHSPAVTVTVLGSLQKPIISVIDNDVQINIASEIPLSVGADLTCSLYTEDVLLHRSVSQKRQSGENHCMFDLTHNELFTRSVNSRNLSCDYYINTEPEIRSPRSDTHTITVSMATSPLPVNISMSEPLISEPSTWMPGLEHPESHQDSTPDPTATDSFIMSENSIYQPSGVLVNTQQKEGNREENENVYHLYCTIPDKPDHSNAGDQVYSLVKMH
ncbi:unnamed protein product [Leuciscus chuanchicus]